MKEMFERIEIFLKECYEWFLNKKNFKKGPRVTIFF